MSCMNIKNQLDKKVNPNGKSNKIFVFGASQIIILLTLGIGLFLLWQAVFKGSFGHILIQKTFTISHLSKAQKNNIKVALHKLNGTIIKPKQVFSFNQIIGSREAKNGYQLSNVYLNGKTEKDFGGGICLLSSVLYQSVLLINLKVIERWSHQKIIHSVPIGLDATVWFGQADLRFENNLNFPLKISALIENDKLKILIYGQKKVLVSKILTKTQKLEKHKLKVQIFLINPNEQYTNKLISTDIYAI